MIRIDEERCNRCGICIPICVRKILTLGEKSAEVTDPMMCIACGHCKAVCPTNAPIFPTGNEEFEPVPSREEIPHPASFLRFLRRRRSLRRYSPRPVERAKIEQILQAGRYAPTGGNRQACELTVVTGRPLLDEICGLAVSGLTARGRRIQEVLDRCQERKEPIPPEYASQKLYPAVWNRIHRAWEEKRQDQLLHHAPALILIHVRPGAAATPDLDVGIVSAQMILMAETLGLGSCYIQFLVWATEESEALRDFLQIPKGNRIHATFTLGYPDVEYLRLVARKPLRVVWVEGESGKGTPR